LDAQRITFEAMAQRTFELSLSQRRCLSSTRVGGVTGTTCQHNTNITVSGKAVCTA